MLILSLKNSFSTLALCWALLHSSLAYSQLNVRTFGAKGDGKNDDSKALTLALQAAVRTQQVCIIPKSAAFYKIATTVRIDVPAGRLLKISSDGAIIRPSTNFTTATERIWKLTPNNEAILFSIGKIGTGNEVRKAFDNSVGRCEISNLIFECNSALDKTSITIALETATAEVALEDVQVSNIKGFGIRTFGGKSIAFKNVSVKGVRGRSKQSDSYGDGLYFAGMSKTARLDLLNCEVTGIVSDGFKPRSGVTFEFNTANYTANITKMANINFAKAIHAEDTPSKAAINIENGTFVNSNYVFTMVGNSGTTLTCNGAFVEVGVNDGFESGDGGITLNTNNGGSYYFKRCKFYLSMKPVAYLSSVGVKEFVDCIFDAKNKNPFFADENLVFRNCEFRRFGGNFMSFYSSGKIKKIALFNCKFVDSKRILHKNIQFEMR